MRTPVRIGIGVQPSEKYFRDDPISHRPEVLPVRARLGLLVVEETRRPEVPDLSRRSVVSQERPVRRDIVRNELPENGEPGRHTPGFEARVHARIRTPETYRRGLVRLAR